MVLTIQNRVYDQELMGIRWYNGQPMLAKGDGVYAPEKSLNSTWSIVSLYSAFEYV